MPLGQAAVTAPPTFWSSVREALRGSHQDFTTGNLNRAILLLAIPMVMEMVLESLFAVVDVFWVGRLGADAVATRLLWVSNIINLVLDPCLIFGWGPFPKLGVTGAALATFTGRSIGVLYQFYRLLRGTERIRILRQQLRINLRILVRLLRVSLTGILQFAIAHTSWIGLVRIVRVLGSAALAGYTIAIRILIFVILPSWGLSNAAATLVGQNLGAKQPERAETSVWRTGLYNMIFLGGIGLFFVIFAEPVIRLFTSDPLVEDDEKE